MSRWIAAAWLLAACSTTAQTPPTLPAPPPDRSVVIVVWDGLRADSIDPADMPNLVRLRDAGTELTDNHATYPTFTMMNAASFATGAFPDATGYYGNAVWQPDATGNDSAGKPVDYRQPVFSEDYAILDALKRSAPQLLMVDTLFMAAQAAGLSTLTIGKTGAAYLQDNARGGMVLDERTVLPLALAKELQAAGIALPATAANAYPAGALVLDAQNGSPTDFKPVQKLKDGVTSDPSDDGGSPVKAALEHMVNAYVEYILPHKNPRLTVVWLRDPDSTEHGYAVGSANWHDALRANDALLGRILAKLEALGKRDATDIIVIADHGHSNVSGPQDLFPLRAVRDGAIAEIDPRGHSVSGLVRLADLMTRAGFTAFDGLGCTHLPGAMGIKRDGAPVYPALTDDDGSVCGKAGQRYQIAPRKVPAQLPPGAIVIAVNGGSDYLYVPDHDPATVRKAVAFLQERAEVGAIFIDDRYGAIPGAMALSAIHARNAAGKNPDIIFSYDFDDGAMISGIKGTELAGMLNGNTYRGMHGSFSPRDVHNAFIAAGPDFRAGFKDPLPTGNVDLAPTIARLLGLPLPRAQGRVLFEALAHGVAVDAYRVTPKLLTPAAPATGLTVRLPTDPSGKDVAPKLSTYNFELHTKALSFGDQTYTYFDFAKATRR
jgi:arylsulfatase A-like enzyme